MEKLSSWDKIKYDFGKVNHSTIQIVEFRYNGDKEVSEIEPLCNCIGHTFKDNVLTLRWKIKQHPPRSYESTKVIMIVYKDQSLDDLTLKAYILK